MFFEIFLHSGFPSENSPLEVKISQNVDFSLWGKHSALSYQNGLFPSLISSLWQLVLNYLPVWETTVEAVGGVGDDFCCWLATSCWSSEVLCWFSCCCFFLTNCSADFRSSKVTPWVDLRVSRTLLAWAFLWVSDSSSRTGGTNDLK